jgi:hypothetical protein
MTWTGESHLSSIAQHGAFIWFIQTTEHRSKSALSSAIFTKQCVYFTREKIEVNAIVRKNSRETFRYLSGR